MSIRTAPPTTAPYPAPLFDLGRVVVTPAALDALTTAFPGEAGAAACHLLKRHQRGDFGNLSDGDRRANNRAILDGDRILSAYQIRPETEEQEGKGKPLTIWIITVGEDDKNVREYTTILLPEDY